MKQCCKREIGYSTDSLSTNDSIGILLLFSIILRIKTKIHTPSSMIIIENSFVDL